MDQQIIDVPLPDEYDYLEKQPFNIYNLSPENDELFLIKNLVNERIYLGWYDRRRGANEKDTWIFFNIIKQYNSNTDEWIDIDQDPHPKNLRNRILIISYKFKPRTILNRLVPKPIRSLQVMARDVYKNTPYNSSKIDREDVSEQQKLILNPSLLDDSEKLVTLPPFTSMNRLTRSNVDNNKYPLSNEHIEDEVFNKGGTRRRSKRLRTKRKKSRRSKRRITKRRRSKRF